MSTKGMFDASGNVGCQSQSKSFGKTLDVKVKAVTSEHDRLTCAGVRFPAYLSKDGSWHAPICLREGRLGKAFVNAGDMLSRHVS